MEETFAVTTTATSMASDSLTASPPKARAGKTLRLGSLNVHRWEDAEYGDNVERVARLALEQDLDLLCLQESPAGHDLSRFQQHTGGAFKYQTGARCGGFGVTVLSRHRLQKHLPSKGSIRARVVTAEVHLEAPLFLTSAHLDYRTEPMRLLELKEMQDKLGDLLAEERHQIWCGDFNALTREDYDEATWEDIGRIRRQNRWESPQTELTKKVRDLGLVDCWECSGRPPPYQTCRFDTRIDYVFASPSFLRAHPLVSCRHVVGDASDHNMVVAEFEM